MKEQKIAVLCNYELLPTRVGGMDYFFWQFDAVCKQQGVQVDWFFPNRAEHGSYKQLTLYSCENTPVEFFFIAHLQQERPAYSHIITHFLELCTPFFKKVKNYSSAQLIASDHNPRPIQGYPLRKQLEKKLKGLLYARYIDVFVGVSEYTRNQLIKDFGNHITNKTRVIFNGLDQNKYHKKTNFSNHNRFIVASHLRKEKGIQDLVQAVYELKKVNQIPFTIDVYGNGPYEATLQQQVADLQLQSTFFFMGSVANLHQLYATYDYLIHPSHGETFCYSVVESLMSCLPVITTQNQGNVLGLVVNGRNGYLFDEKNVTELKEILNDILLGRKAVNALRNSNLDTNNFTLESMVANHFKLIF